MAAKNKISENAGINRRFLYQNSFAPLPSLTSINNYSVTVD